LEFLSPEVRDSVLVMDEQVSLPRNGPSLRIARFTVENFRSITEPVEIALGDASPSGDPIVVFHGRNGAGKSTALLALALTMRLLQGGFGRGAGTFELGSAKLPDVFESVRLGRQGTTVRDLAHLGEKPLRLRIDFQDRQLGGCEFVLRRSGSRTTLETKIDREQGVGEEAFQQSVFAPFGPSSRPFDALDSRRYASWVNTRAADTLIQPEFAEALFALRVSRDPREREAWRYFSEVLQRFEAFRGKHVSIDRIGKDKAPELTFEDRGKLILGLDDLSSGEQQIVALVSGVLLSNAAVLAIEEPELNLDGENQSLLRNILEEVVARGFKDQIFLESHVPSFDGPGVVRFNRTNGQVRAERVVSENNTTELARRSGALPQWVSREGYTLLPQPMRESLHLTNGGPLWFLRGARSWEAWREDELVQHLGGDEDKSDV
jgi:energy-coupling factor transporter ATP-binding protein EcfA2